MLGSCGQNIKKPFEDNKNRLENRIKALPGKGLDLAS
jgi:hypothetical protein